MIPRTREVEHGAIETFISKMFGGYVHGGQVQTIKVRMPISGIEFNITWGCLTLSKSQQLSSSN